MEGIGEILNIPDTLMGKLEEADGYLRGLSDSADKLARAFERTGTAAKKLVDDLGKKDFSMKVDFGADGALKQIDMLIKASDEANKKGRTSSKAISTTEEKLNTSLDKILNKRVKTYDDANKRIYELTAWLEKANALTKSKADSKDSPVSQGFLDNIKKAEDIIGTYTQRLIDMKGGYNAAAAEDAVAKALNASFDTYDQAVEKLGLIKKAISEVLKPTGNSATAAQDATKNTGFLAALKKQEEEVIKALPELQRKMEDAQKKIVADGISKELKDAFTLPDKEPEELIKKIEAIKSAISNYKKAERGDNPFLPKKEFEDAKRMLSEITKDKEELDKIGRLTQKANNIMGLDDGTMEDAQAKLNALKSLYMQLQELGAPLDSNEMRNLKGEIDKVNDKIRQTKDALSLANNSARFFQSTMRSLFPGVALTKAVKDIVSIRGEFELAEKSIAVIVRDAGQAKEIFNDVKKIAIKSPFQISDLVKQTKQLAAYRIESDKLVETTKMLGDISAGTGVEINRLILAYGQVKAATVLKGTELRQFSEAGVNMLGGLAERFSELQKRAVSTGEVLSMISKKMVSFEDVDAVLRSQVAQGGTFYRMQEQQAETIKGMVSNLKDRLDIMFDEIGADNEGFIKGILQMLNWLMEHYQTLLTVLSSVATFKFVLGGFVAIGKKIEDVTKAADLLAKAFNKSAKAAEGLSKATVITAVFTAIAVAIVMAVQRMNEFNKAINNIITDSLNSAEDLTERFTTLSSIAADLTASEKTRVKAINDLKNEYGNILNLENLDLNNAHELNDSLQERIDLIREYAYEQAKEKAVSEAIERLNKKAEKRLKTLYEGNNNAGLSSFIETFKSQVRGLELIDEDQANRARVIIERKLLNGTLKSATEARNEYLRTILKMADATEEQIEEIFNSMGEGSFGSIIAAFEPVLEQMDSVNKKFDEAWDGLALTAAPFKEQIKDLQNFKQEFEDTLTLEKKAEYEHNPAQQKLDMEEFLQNRKKEIADAILSSQGSGSITQTTADALMKSLNGAFNQLTIGESVERIVTEAQAEINKEFPNLKFPIGTGQGYTYDTEKSTIENLKKLKDAYEELSKAQSILNKDKSKAAVEEVVKVWSRLDWGSASYAEHVTDAKAAIMEQMEATETMINHLDNGVDAVKDMAEEERNLVNYANRLMSISKEWVEASEDRKDQLRMDAFDESLDFKFEIAPPTDLNVDNVVKFIRENIVPQLSGAARTNVNLSITGMDDYKKGLNEILGDTVNIADSWNDLSDESKVLVIQKVANAIDDLKANFPETLDFEMNPPSPENRDEIVEWVKNFIQYLKDDDQLDLTIRISDLEAKWAKAEAEANNRAAQAAKQRASELKSFISTLKIAIKEYNNLDEATRDYENQLLKMQAKKLGIKMPEDMSPDKLEAWVDSLQKKLGKDNWLELKVDFGKERVSEEIEDMKNQVNELWDKWDTSKKAADFGIILSGMNPSKIYSDILAIEEKLSNSTSDLAKDAAEEIRQKRLQILRTEQEEAMKIMYESQKKALNKTEQAYQEMFEDINKIRSSANASGLEKIDESIIGEDITARITKGFKDIADAEWEAYKGSEMYIAAFGNLDGLSVNVLDALEKDLKDWLSRAAGTLEATEVKAIQNALTKISDRKEELKAKNFFEIFTDGFKKIREARELMEKSGELELDLANARKVREDADKALDAANEAVLKTQNALSKAKSAYDSAQSNYASSLVSGSPDEQEEAANALTKALLVLLEAEEKVVKAQEDASDASESATNAAKEESNAMGEVADNANTISNKLNNATKALTTLKGAFDKMSNLMSETIGLVEDTAEAFGVAFSDDTTSVIEAFVKGFNLLGAAIDVATAATELFTLAEKGATVAGVALSTVLPILAAVALVVGSITAVIKAKDNSIKNSIEGHTKAVERLSKTYDNLQDAMENALTYASAKSTYDQMNANIEQQRQHLEDAIWWENQRKKPDTEAIDGYKEQLSDLDKKDAETENQMKELLGMPSNYQDVANDWASSWLDAFKETGDGLDSLNESFDEMYENLVIGMLQTKVMGPAVQNLKNMLEQFYGGDQQFDDTELAQLMAAKDELRGLNDKLIEAAKAAGIEAGSGAGGADNTLQKGIESITETTAQALESLLNSMRYYVVDSNGLIARISAVLTGDGENESPILKEMKTQTSLIRSIDSLLGSMSRAGHPMGGYGLKVFMG